MKAINLLVALCFVLSACGPSSEQLTAAVIVAQAQTQTAAPTKTSTPEPTKTPTPEPTKTLPSSKGVIKIGAPENPEIYIYEGPLISFLANEEQFNKIVSTPVNADPFSICPDVWIVAAPDATVPTYTLYLDASHADQKKGFFVAFHPTTPETEPYGVTGFGVITTDINGKFIVTSGYQPTKGQPNPEELEIQVIFTGCEIYKEIVIWP